MRTCTSLLIALGWLVSPSASGEPAGEWPCFHGPRRDNKSTETGLLKSWPADGPKLLWGASGLGKGYSSVSVAGGRIHAAGMYRGQTAVVAFDMDGRLLWRKTNGPAWRSTMSHAVAYDGARGTPTVDDGRVYQLGECGRLAAFDARTGDEVWALDLFKAFGAETPKYGLGESVLIDGDKLICCPGGTKGYMVCLEKKTGKLLWANTEIEGTVGYSSLVPVEFGGFRQLLGMSAKAVYGVDAATGKLLWSIPHANVRENSATDPVFHDGHVFATTGYGKGSILVRLAARAGGIAAETAWSTKLMDNHHGGVVLVDGCLYGAGHEAKGWFCLDFLTGKPAWRADGKGSLTWAEGMLYCLDEKGTMSLVEATPKEYRPVSSFGVPKGGAGLYWAHPVVCGGRLYIRHADKLLAYAIRAK